MEGVDRNVIAPGGLPGRWVALLMEGVDRNDIFAYNWMTVIRSPSSRRAWIEISTGTRWAWIEIGLPCRSPRHSLTVALLAEGVDRNTSIFLHLAFLCRSPSSRRAWIEIL